jgi:energy-converting hydrogenase A subunit R
MKRASGQRIFVSDCEGPISRNDNAFELASHFIPNGDRLFTLISRYDDVLADVAKRPSYKAGDTLKLILPFLKAYGVTNRAILDYSSRNALLVPGAKDMLLHVQCIMPSYIVSTSYEQYMRVLSDILGFPFEKVYSTRLDLDRYEISPKEAMQIRKLGQQMVKMPVPEIPKGAKSLADLSKEQQQSVNKLDEIFWKEFSQMSIAKMMRDINPVGGDEKAEAVQSIVAKLKIGLNDVMYVGDSITDVSVFRLVRDGGGLTVSFNGNAYAVREAEIVVLSENAIITGVLAIIFREFGKEAVMKSAKNWKLSTLTELGLTESLKKSVSRLLQKQPPRLEIVTTESMERLMKDSTSFRKTVRGEAIGKLG